MSRLKECAFVLSSSALDYGKRPFTINSFCAVQYRLSRKKKEKEKVLQAVYAAYGRDGSFTQVSFCIFQTLGPNLYATLLYIEIHCLVGNTIYFCTNLNLFYRKILYINGTMKYATFHKRILSKNIIRTYVVRKK